MVAVVMSGRGLLLRRHFQNVIKRKILSVLLPYDAGAYCSLGSVVGSSREEQRLASPKVTSCPPGVFAKCSFISNLQCNILWQILLPGFFLLIQLFLNLVLITFSHDPGDDERREEFG